MRKIDYISINIYHSLVTEYENNIKENGPYLNIFGIFMHEIMKYLTNYIIIENSNYNYNFEMDFPYLNTKYIKQPFHVLSLNSKQITTNKQKLLKNIFKLSIFSKKNITICEDTPSEVKKYLIKNIFRFNISYTNRVKCFLPTKMSQINKLKDFLLEFCLKYKVLNHDIFIQNFIQYIELYIQDNECEFNGEYFIGGSNSILSNRIMAAYFLANGKQVISLAHGEQDMLTLDDPYCGYADMSFCTYYISYGSRCLTFNNYNTPLPGHKPTILRRNSEIVNNFYKNNSVDSIDIKKPALYIPTSFSKNRRYGPFRDMDDEDYLSWQCEIFDKKRKIFYKGHPSNYFKPDFVNIDEMVYDNLKNINFNEYGYIILDYMSTAFALAAASSIPIIYFNLGLMNISEDVIEDVKSRVFWVDIDLTNDIKPQIESALLTFIKVRRNYKKNYTSQYSLADNRLKDILAKILV